MSVIRLSSFIRISIMETEKKITKPTIPDFIKGCLWSYDLKSLDLERDFKRIITNILIYGDIKAIKWLFNTFSKKQIKDVISDPLKGEWDAESLNFWSVYLKVTPNKKKALKQFTNI